MKPNMFDDTDVPPEWVRLTTWCALGLALAVLFFLAARGLWCVVSH